MPEQPGGASPSAPPHLQAAPGAAGDPSGPDERWTAPVTPTRLVGRHVVVRQTAVMLAWYVLTGFLVVRLGGGTDTGPAVAVLVAAPIVNFTAQTAQVGRRVARKARDLRGTARQSAAVPPELIALLSGRGIRRTEIWMESGRVRSRSFRTRDRAWIVMAQRHVARRGPRWFVTAHEVTHLVRNDALTSRVCWALAIGLLGGAVLSGAPAAAAVGCAGALLLFVGKRWYAEFSCDLVAARWAGPASMSEWVADHRTLLRAPQNRSAAKRLRRGLVSWLTHPPLWLRLAWVRARVRA